MPIICLARCCAVRMTMCLHLVHLVVRLVHYWQASQVNPFHYLRALVVLLRQQGHLATLHPCCFAATFSALFFCKMEIELVNIFTIAIGNKYTSMLFSFCTWLVLLLLCNFTFFFLLLWCSSGGTDLCGNIGHLLFKVFSARCAVQHFGHFFSTQCSRLCNNANIAKRMVHDLVHGSATLGNHLAGLCGIF